MPCTYYTPEEETRRAKAAFEDKRIENESLRRQIDQLTRFLCEALRSYNPEYLEDLLEGNLELNNWWKDHQKRDAARLRKEAAAKFKAEQIKAKKKAEKKARKEALDKLTDEEKVLLGL